jgi:hypothetical protein
MRIFVSSSFEDLREHRAAVIRVLRQLGHEVLAMEDLTAASAAPLSRVLDLVDRSEAYVGVFAWRYGFVPGASLAPSPVQPTGSVSPTPAAAPLVPLPAVDGAAHGQTSITHYEYLRALQRKLPVMAFLLDEQFPWPPQLIDGFDPMRPQGPANNDQIRALRLQLQQERVVSWFTTPSDLEARVSAAVTMAGLTRQLELQPANALEPTAGNTLNSSAESGIKPAILNAGENQCALKIDLATIWWSTRLYLLAALAERLTQVRRILIVDTASTVVPAGEAVAGGAAAAVALAPASGSAVVEERFIGQLSTGAILSAIRPKCDALGKFQEWLQGRPMTFNDLEAECQELLRGWERAFGDAQYIHGNEEAAKVNVTPELLRRWFMYTMLQQPVHIADLQRASVVDLLRLLDYPNDYVPVLTRHLPASEGMPVLERVDIMDKKALNARLARSYLVELMDRARIV